MSKSISTAAATAAARYFAGLTAKAEVGLIVGSDERIVAPPPASSSAAIFPICGASAIRAAGSSSTCCRRSCRCRSSAFCSPPTVSRRSIGSIRSRTCSPRPGSARPWRRLQDLVLPRMRATAGATYILGTTMVGLALGPYFAGKMSAGHRRPRHGHRRALFHAGPDPARPVDRLPPHRDARSHQGRARPRRRASRSRRSTPQAIRAPLLPLGSVR